MACVGPSLGRNKDINYSPEKRGPMEVRGPLHTLQCLMPALLKVLYGIVSYGMDYRIMYGIPCHNSTW